MKKDILYNHVTVPVIFSIAILNCALSALPLGTALPRPRSLSGEAGYLSIEPIPKWVISWSGSSPCEVT